MAKKSKKEDVKVTQITDNSARLMAVKIAMQQIQKHRNSLKIIMTSTTYSVRNGALIEE